VISLKNKLKVPPVAPEPPQTPSFQNTAVLPPEPSRAATEFNLVLLVKEHGPSRMKYIDTEVRKLQEKIDKLKEERGQITKLLQSIGEPVG
jgi:hypothetical protein